MKYINYKADYVADNPWKPILKLLSVSIESNTQKWGCQQRWGSAKTRFLSPRGKISTQAAKLYSSENTSQGLSDGN